MMETFSLVHLYNTKLNKGGKAVFDFPENHNTGFLLIGGTLKINDIEILDKNHFT